MVIALIQARMESERLPGKALLQLGSRPVLAWVVRAATDSDVFDEVIVATSDQRADDPIADLARNLGVASYRGDVEDVLGRFLGAISDKDATVISRLTGDCPLLDPSLLSGVVQTFEIMDVDYLSTITPRSLPRGLDVEVLSVDALRRVAAIATGPDRTHVTSAIYTNPHLFRIAGLTFQPDSSDLRVTLDTDEDLTALRAIVAALGDGPHSYQSVIAFLRQNGDVASINAHVKQKELQER